MFNHHQDGAVKRAVQALAASKEPDVSAVMLADAEDALRKSDFARYLMWFEGHDRLSGFLQIEPLLSDRDYWPMLRDVWLHSEIMLPHKDIWLRLLLSERKNRELLMTEADNLKFAAMGDQLTIYRGFASERSKDGISWTLNLERAKWFSLYAGDPRRRFMGSWGRLPRVVSGACLKSNVLAFFSQREEEEVVIDPRSVRNKTVFPVD
jgi:hypothetical protein